MDTEAFRHLLIESSSNDTDFTYLTAEFDGMMP